MTRDEAHRTPIPMTDEEIAAYHRIGELPPPSCLVAPDLHDGSAAAASDVSRVDRALQTRRVAPRSLRDTSTGPEPEFGRSNPGDTVAFVGPKIPSWVQDPARWVTLSRAERRALERHHRRANLAALNDSHRNAQRDELNALRREGWAGR